MDDIEERLRIAMHEAIDGEEASPDELIIQVMRRNRRHTAGLAGTAVLAALAIGVTAVVALHSSVSPSGQPSSTHVTQPPVKLPTSMSGLPMPAGTNLKFLLSTRRGASWYSTDTRRTEPISGVPAAPGGYQFVRVWGGWATVPLDHSSSCPVTQCAGPPATFYFIAYGSLTATRIGRGYAEDGVDPGSRPGTVWLVTYPRSTSKLTSSSFAQLVNTAGQPLGKRYRMPPNYLMGRGVGKYLLLDLNTDQTQWELWDPVTDRVAGRFDNVVAQGPEQVVWSKGCQRCRLEITNVSTGKTVTGPTPDGQPGNVNVALSDDGRLLAVQLPNRELGIVNTDTGVMTRIDGTALSVADFEGFDWQNEGHRLIITAGPISQPGPDQIAYWQPGARHLYVTTIRNLRELPAIETGAY